MRVGILSLQEYSRNIFGEFVEVWEKSCKFAVSI
jgi:hypothetical protein